LSAATPPITGWFMSTSNANKEFFGPRKAGFALQAAAGNGFSRVRPGLFRSADRHRHGSRNRARARNPFGHGSAAGNVMRRSCRLLASINVAKVNNQTSSVLISGRFYT
jgi:hypothetical protein